MKQAALPSRVRTASSAWAARCPRPRSTTTRTTRTLMASTRGSRRSARPRPLLRADCAAPAARGPTRAARSSRTRRGGRIANATRTRNRGRSRSARARACSGRGIGARWRIAPSRRTSAAAAAAGGSRRCRGPRTPPPPAPTSAGCRARNRTHPAHQMRTRAQSAAATPRRGCGRTACTASPRRNATSAVATRTRSMMRNTRASASQGVQRGRTGRLRGVCRRTRRRGSAGAGSRLSLVGTGAGSSFAAHAEASSAAETASGRVGMPRPRRCRAYKKGTRMRKDLPYTRLPVEAGPTRARTVGRRACAALTPRPIPTSPSRHEAASEVQVYTDVSIAVLGMLQPHSRAGMIAGRVDIAPLERQRLLLRDVPPLGREPVIEPQAAAVCVCVVRLPLPAVACIAVVTPRVGVVIRVRASSTVWAVTARRCRAHGDKPRHTRHRVERRGERAPLTRVRVRGPEVRGERREREWRAGRERGRVGGDAATTVEGGVAPAALRRLRVWVSASCEGRVRMG
ncbi:hypothetical protein B0H11DRAFT_212797 [Mycena galericulata]|nr:hypothetical protein B0H11DRAFT_212797 [Mycena galericulata]